MSKTHFKTKLNIKKINILNFLFFQYRGGVQKNLVHFAKLGISADQIVVVVMQDGIEKIDETVLEGIFDKQDNIN